MVTAPAAPGSSLRFEDGFQGNDSQKTPQRPERCPQFRIGNGSFAGVMTVF